MSTRVDLPMDQVVRDYEAGISAAELARRYGTTTHTVLARLRKAGVAVRTRPYYPSYPPEVADHVAKAYGEGTSIAQIARDLGIGNGTVWRALRLHGIEPRPQGLRSRTVRAPSDPAKLGYLAGLLDGEGNLQVRARKDRSVGCKLAIYSTTPAVMDWLVENVGGAVRWDHKRTEQRGWRPIGIWEVYRARDVALLLEALFPLLLIKRETARTMLNLFRAQFGW